MANTDDEQITVTIQKSEYARLLRDCKKLDALEVAGVDNWEGYDMAMEIMRGES